MANVHTFVEETTTTSSNDTIKLAMLADEQRWVFMVRYNRRYAPLVEKVKALISAPYIRTCVIEKCWSLVHPSGYDETFFDDWNHQIDLLRNLCG
jgi:predicted dehydrogenase